MSTVVVVRMDAGGVDALVPDGPGIVVCHIGAIGGGVVSGAASPCTRPSDDEMCEHLREVGNVASKQVT
jgi:hypothetical protein